MTIDRSFFPEPEPVSVARIIELGNCFLRKGSPDFTVKDVGALDQAASEFLVFAINKQLIQELKSAHGYALICTHELLEEFGETILSGAEVILVSQNPRYLFAQACSIIYPEQGTNSGSIHPTAQIDKSANIAQDVTIGPFCCIAAGVAIGRGSSLGAGVNCAPSVKIGEDCQIGDYVTLEKTIIDGGSSVGQHSVIGKAGFGFESHENDIQKIPHLGRVIIGRRTSIGAHCCIDRGTIQDTRIADLVMIDNMVHIAHNVQIGRKSIILAQAGIAGSSIIGENCIIG
ncbi:MAG: UDP-3-O-(3-hydroxymyristoyl)glucosamine N-acyltransferase, partial [SAR116 cluster bacterium]